MDELGDAAATPAPEPEKVSEAAALVTTVTIAARVDLPPPHAECPALAAAEVEDDVACAE
jgi:hypothetical protein